MSELARMILKCWMLLSWFLLSAQGWADMLDTSAMQPWEVCGMCHGLEGYSPVEKFPILAGQKKAYLVKQLRDFRRGERSNDGGQMQSIVEEYGESDLQQVADYFSGLKPPLAQSGPDDDRQWQQGRKLYQQKWVGEYSCKNCHDPEPAEAVANYQAPILFGQHRAYLRKQLIDFREGQRMNDPDAHMRTVSAALSQQDIEALAVYLHLGSSAQSEH